jgi:hypothetical protein
MSNFRRTVWAVALTLCLLPGVGAASGWDSILDSVKKAVGSSDTGGDEIADGLREALRIGSENAVSDVSVVDGYLGNPDIKILLPEPVEKVEKALRLVGYGDELDAFEVSMNRAAEAAAPQAKAIFWDAVGQMQFEDAKKILNGRENEATLYFKEKTYSRLQEIFKPIVSDSMGNVGVTRQFQDINQQLAEMPFADQLAFDLDQYVTDKGLDGLFHMLALEEKKIRQDPAARVTDLLKKVFGNQP